MNCANHPEVPAAAFCRQCGKAMCLECQRPALGSIYCQDHVPVTAQSAATPPPLPGDYLPPRPNPSFADSPYSDPVASAVSPADPHAHPVLALILGFIPGVGAIYNGQYAKGLVHVVILGLLISIVSSGGTGGFEAVFGMLIGAWYLYMPFEAYHTARKRQLGERLDEWSSIMPMKQSSGFPVGPVILIAVGVIFLLNTLEIVRLYQIVRWWPLFLIVLGAYMLYARVAGASAPEQPSPLQEAPREH